MAQYALNARTGTGASVVQVTIDSIEQEGQVIADMVIVNAVRSALLTAPGVVNVLARKYERVITTV